MSDDIAPAQRPAATFEDPATIVAERREQAGLEFMTAQCPRGGLVHSVLGTKATQIACQCGAWIDLQ